MLLPPISFSSDTNHKDKIKNYEINSLFDGDNLGFRREDSSQLELTVAFNYPPSTFIQ